MLGPWAVAQPILESTIDVAIIGIGKLPPEVLTHQRHTCLVQVERDRKRRREFGECHDRNYIGRRLRAVQGAVADAAEPFFAV